MSNSNLSPQTSLQYQFVIDFHNKLKAGWQLAASALKESVDKSREHQSLNPRVKTFAVDEQVLVLLPTSNNKLSLTLQGPFNIAKKLRPVVYLVDFGHRVSPLHVNLLRKYHRDSTYQIKQPTSTVSAENTTAKANAASHQPAAFEPALLPFAHASMEFDPLIFPFASEDIEMPSEMPPSIAVEDDIATMAYVQVHAYEEIDPGPVNGYEMPNGMVQEGHRQVRVHQYQEINPRSFYEYEVPAGMVREERIRPKDEAVQLPYANSMSPEQETKGKNHNYSNLGFDISEEKCVYVNTEGQEISRVK
ncbi:hypothetical protein PoB_007315300 [Plakobranchus ocellatus]|uniref:Uncharacterized protein n=1 Tax=Plakobranchus ocellatus TaxID=259542 RepID=A0AAV4DQR3_9GAST|nr:hypothetical protein PoB_007315300 [Plakobranchus ocellatus]